MIGGELLGKLIILSFRDDEEALFSKAISALSSVADFSTVAASADTPLLFGSVQIDPQRRLVWQAGQTVELTPMEFDILLLLARRPGQVFTARQIYEAVAADSFGASWTGISSMEAPPQAGGRYYRNSAGPRLPDANNKIEGYGTGVMALVPYP